jgi:plastocyanin
MRLGSAGDLVAGVLLACSLLLSQTLPIEPARDSGASVTGAFEGWFKNADGTFSLLLGYYNRNRNQEVDLPVGPNNRIEPGGPDRGQPTHFLPGRGWGLFAVKVPADFGESKITWSIMANGKTTVIPASLKPDYEISPFIEAAVGNTPPVLSFDEKGPSVQGPQGMSVERTAKAGVPLALTVWVSDDAKFTSSSGARPKDPGDPVTVRWTTYRGTGSVTFASDRPTVLKVDRKDNTAPFNGKATTSVTFAEPGEYVLHVTANDYSGEGGAGFQCCWTNGQVKVTVQR